MQKNLRFSKSRWGCEHVHVCAYIYIVSRLCVLLACCTPSNHPIMVNVKQEIFKCSKLSQIWLNIQKHFSVTDVFVVLSILLHTKPLLPPFIKLNELLKPHSRLTRIVQLKFLPSPQYFYYSPYLSHANKENLTAGINSSWGLIQNCTRKISCTDERY